MSMFESVFKAVADFSDVRDEAGTAGDALQKMGQKADGADGKVGKAKGGLGSTTKVALGAVAAIGGVVLAMSGLISEAAAVSDSTDKFRKTMEFAGLDTAAIDDASKKAREYADATVYSLTDIQNITATLASNGVKNYDTLGMALGNLNAVAGGNAETFGRVGSVLTQTAGAGKLTTENWNQMSAAIPGAAGPLMKALSDAGAYTGNFRDAMSKGEITAEEFNAAIMELGNQPVAVEAATSVETFEGAVGNLQASIVGGLSDAFTTLKPLITDALGGLTDGLEWMKANGPIVTAVLAGLGAALLVALAPAIWAAVTATWAFTLALLANPLTWVALGVGLLVAALVLLAQNWDAVVAWVTSVWGGFVAWLGGLWGQIVAGATSAWEGVKSSATGAWNALVSFLVGVGDRIKSGLSAAWTSVKTTVANVWNGIVSFLKGTGDKIKKTLTDAGENAKTTLSNAWNAVKTATTTKFNEVVTFIKSIPGKILAGLASLASLGSKAAAWFGSFVSSARSKFGEAVEFVRGIPGKIVSALGSLGTRLSSAGSSLINGFLSGMKGAWGQVTSWASGAMDRLRGLWPFSPAKWGPFSGHGYVTYSGEAIGTDFAQSLADQSPIIGRGALKMLQTASDVMHGFGSIDVEAAVRLDPHAVSVADGSFAVAQMSGSVTTAVLDRGTSGGTTYQLYLEGWQVGMDSKLESAVRDLVDAVDDRRRFDRAEGGV